MITTAFYDPYRMSSIEHKPSIAPKYIGGLLTHTYSISSETLTQVAVKEFKRLPHLPGVLLTVNQKFGGMVSSRKCIEHLSYPYGVELFMQRPISHLYEHIKMAPTIITAETHIDQAVQIALARPPEQRYEPLVVHFEPHEYRLLDLHTLLMAQSKMLETANRLVLQQVDIGRALSSTLEFKKVMRLILNHLGDLVPYQRAGVILRKGEFLEFVAWNGFPAGLKAAELRMLIRDNDIFMQISRTRKPLLLADISQRQDWTYVQPLPVAHSWLGLPLIHSGEVIGMLSLARTRPTPFNEEELELARSFADQAAIALQNAALYDEIKGLNQNLEELVQERTAALQTAYQHLQTLEQAKTDFITITSHELRTPLTIVSGYAQMLISDPEIQTNSGQFNMATGIHNGMKRLSEIMNSLLDIARIDHKELHLHPEQVHIGEIIHKVKVQFTNALTTRRQSLQIEAAIDELPPIWGDGTALQKVFVHLINNSMKYTPDGGAIRITGNLLTGKQSPFENENGLQIVISDTGIGIAPENLQLIFTKFYQTGKASHHSSGATKFKGGGPGLGLAIVRGIVEAHGGHVWAESPGYDEILLPGSQFHTILPVRGQIERAQPIPHAGAAL